MNDHICDKLLKKKWQRYDTSSVSEKPGIYAIGIKAPGEHKTRYLYVGQAKNMKTRLKQHKSSKNQAISEMVAKKFKKRKESELRIKYVPEKKHKLKEGEYIMCLTKRSGYRPELNKRAGDGLGSRKGSAKSKARRNGSSQARSVGRPLGGSDRMIGAFIQLCYLALLWLIFRWTCSPTSLFKSSSPK